MVRFQLGPSPVDHEKKTAERNRRFKFIQLKIRTCITAHIQSCWFPPMLVCYNSCVVILLSQSHMTLSCNHLDSNKKILKSNYEL